MTRAFASVLPKPLTLAGVLHVIWLDSHTGLLVLEIGILKHLISHVDVYTCQVKMPQTERFINDQLVLHGCEIALSCKAPRCVHTSVKRLWLTEVKGVLVSAQRSAKSPITTKES